MDAEDLRLLSLNPFEYNWESEHIACVGENGGTDNDTILTGFRDAAIILINKIKNEHGTEDELIYPLVFSIRHSIELSLKIIIEYTREIYDQKKI